MNENTCKCAEFKEKEFTRRKKTELEGKSHLRCFDIAGYWEVKVPEWFLRDVEFEYRRGYYRAMRDASELVWSLCNVGGYLRPTEISNILAKWAEDLRRNWFNRTLIENPLNVYETPKLKQESWFVIRNKVMAERGAKCSNCGNHRDLHIHHVHPVKDGGTPEIDNLVPLCKDCHDIEHSE